MNKNFKSKNKQKGFSIIEVIIYFSIFTTISVLVVTSIMNLFKNYNVIRTNQALEYNAISVLDKLTRDVRDAKDVNINESSFSVPQGSISLNIASSTNENVTNKVRFYLENNKIKYMIDNVYFGDLSTNNINVSNFRIFYINSSSTEAVKVELTLNSKSNINNENFSKNFYTTIQLRQ